jgi:acetylornithine deacetylase/succinyl-diaminopimelate desuccinylase-like protein
VTGEAVNWVEAADRAAIEPRWLDEIYELLRIPSVSAGEEHAADVLRCAVWICDYIRAGGGQADLVPTKRQPLVVAWIEATVADPASAPTVLLYAHFDVQPPGDLHMWHSPPFEPEIRNGWIYGRGATDDKIHLYILLRAALDLAAEDSLPVNVRIVADGEEESIGDTIVDWLRSDTEPVDFALVFDGTMFQPGEVVATIATRGLAYYELEVETGTRDLHSGIFGGVGLNAIHVLQQMIAAVVPPPPELATGALEVTTVEAAAWDAVADWAAVLESSGGRPISDGVISDFNRTTCFMPCVDVNGISGGDAELDATIIPVRARAHISLRLAPGQQPDVVCPIFEQLLRDAAPANATVRIVQRAANPPSHTDPDLAALRVFSEVIEQVTGRPPVMLPWGASIPLLAALEERGIPNVLTGFGLPDAAVHAPNERFPVAYVGVGMNVVRGLLGALGTQSLRGARDAEARR